MGANPALTLLRKVSALAGTLRWRGPVGDDARAQALDAEVALPQVPDRPAGRLIWCHGATTDDVAPIESLVPRLSQAMGEGFGLLATTPGPLADMRLGPGVLHQPAPGDSALATSRFLDHWRPDVGIICGGALHTALIQAAKARGVPLFWVNAPWERSSHRWRRWASDTGMADFVRIFPATRRDADELRLTGVDPERIEIRGLLREAPVPLPCNEAERDALARRLASRPVWLAAGLGDTTFVAVEAAHRHASRLSHRLLLVAVPDEAGGGRALADRFEAEGWEVGLRSAGDRPNAETQVFVADTEGEMGLWYRLAPVSFLAATLDPEGTGPSPYDPAALGSAIVHGPHPGIHKARFERLSLAGASRQIASEADLGPVIAELLAPDKTAALAEAAWRVTSDGAVVADRVIEAIASVLEGEGIAA
ncbi:3-deoxy-D-manno-octulosonic acid transferase [Palleronia sp. KMU-117]|uniref:3-deoxy-D-manno-octulosonic acid transferase n=1 Tax=Palleronia sp. KMU-117 TaxID=3434108 RepID=UPI003D71C1E6